MNRRPGGRELETVFLRMMIEELARSGGRPPGARFVFQLNPQVGVWEFQFQETWVVFTRELMGGWWARLRNRQQVEILLVELLFDPPLPAQLASLARRLNLPGSWRAGRSPLPPPE
jgi:hypothetical protein